MFLNNIRMKWIDALVSLNQRWGQLHNFNCQNTKIDRTQWKQRQNSKFKFQNECHNMQKQYTKSAKWSAMCLLRRSNPCEWKFKIFVFHKYLADFKISTHHVSSHHFHWWNTLVDVDWFSIRRETTFLVIEPKQKQNGFKKSFFFQNGR